MIRQLLIAACFLAALLLGAKVWFDSLVYNGWPDYELAVIIWHNLGSPEDLMILTALALALGFLAIGRYSFLVVLLLSHSLLWPSFP